jgi:hypothetical protein
MGAVADRDGGAVMSATYTYIERTTGGESSAQPNLGPQVSPKAHDFDFISTYADFVDIFEMPRQVHEWVGAQMIASVLNGNVSIKWGAVTYPLDLWVLLLSGSGQGRNTSTDVALEVIEGAGIEGLLHKTTWGSKAAFYQQTAESPCGLYVWPEFSIALRTLNDPKFTGVKEWITDRYDNLREPSSITYRQTGKKSDTPPIEFHEAPRMNILATSSSDWFLNSLEQADTTGGFVARWLPMRVDKSDRLIPKPVSPNREFLTTLVERLKSISKLRGDADLSQVEHLYEEWYRDAHPRFAGQPNSALAMPFFNRLRGEVLKLAVIFEVSQSGALKVTEDALKRAIAVVSEAEKTIVEFLPSGMSREGSEVEKMAERIRSAGPAGISKSDLTRAFQHVKRRDRDERLDTLGASGRVQMATKKTTGRPVQIYIHEDYFATLQASAQEE